MKHNYEYLVSVTFSTSIRPNSEFWLPLKWFPVSRRERHPVGCHKSRPVKCQKKFVYYEKFEGYKETIYPCTRWRRLDNGSGEKKVDENSGKPVLEFVCIQRRDTGVWAIPGGMVDPGERVSATVKREFMEEAMDSTGAAKDNVEELQRIVKDFFDDGDEVR